MSSGFVAGTFVMTDEDIVPIQNLKVGDLILSNSKDKNGQVEFKPVTNIYIHENKEVWMVRANKHFDLKKPNGDWLDYDISKYATRNIDFLVTPNHPIYVVGKGTKKDESKIVLDEFILYSEPRWKQIKKLERFEILVNSDGVMYYIDRVQPLFRFDTDLETLEIKPSYMWYQDDYYGREYDKFGNVIKYDSNGNWIEPDDYGNPDEYEEISLEEIERRRNSGLVFSLESYLEKGWLLGKSVYGAFSPLNTLKDEKGNYIPFTTTVYNLEVADNHNYFAGYGNLYVGDSTIQGNNE